MVLYSVCIYHQVLQHVRNRARSLSRDASFRRQTQPRSVSYAAGGEQPIAEESSTPMMERGFRTLRNGSRAAAHIIGRFFGVTEDSQMGNTESIGWAEVAQQSAQVKINMYIVLNVTQFHKHWCINALLCLC